MLLWCIEWFSWLFVFQTGEGVKDARKGLCAHHVSSMANFLLVIWHSKVIVAVSASCVCNLWGKTITVSNCICKQHNIDLNRIWNSEQLQERTRHCSTNATFRVLEVEVSISRESSHANHINLTSCQQMAVEYQICMPLSGFCMFVLFVAKLTNVIPGCPCHNKCPCRGRCRAWGHYAKGSQGLRGQLQLPQRVQPLPRLWSPGACGMYRLQQHLISLLYPQFVFYGCLYLVDYQFCFSVYFKFKKRNLLNVTLTGTTTFLIMALWNSAHD